MICSVLRSKDTNEIEQVLAPNGDDSILFSDINKLVPEKENSLRLWAQTYTKTFLSWFQNGKKDVNGEALLDGELFTNEKGEQKSLYNRGSFLSKNNDISIEKKPAELLLPYGKEGTPYQFEIKRNNSPIGDVHVVEDNGILSVYDTQLKEKGNNNGTYAYLKIAEYAKNNNLTFTSDVLEDVSDAAKALWNRFVQTGQAQLEGNRYVFTGDVNKVTDNIYAEVPDSLVNYNLKSVEILNSPKADEIFRKGDKNSWSIEKILQELQIPKEQQELIKGFNTRNREQILTSLLANYSYTVEINTTKSPLSEMDRKIGLDENDNINTSYYSNLTVPGGTNGSYREQNFETPLIKVPKSHAQFNTENTIGFTRGDDRIQYSESDIESLISTMEKSGILKINCA